MPDPQPPVPKSVRRMDEWSKDMRKTYRLRDFAKTKRDIKALGKTIERKAKGAASDVAETVSSHVEQAGRNLQRDVLRPTGKGLKKLARKLGL